MKRRAFLKNISTAVAGISLASLPIEGCLEFKKSVKSFDKKPNILLLFSDQHHAGVMGCEGHPDVKTPNLDQLAAKGVRFNRAYCQDGICAPSRASIMTGQYPRTLGVLDNPDVPPYPERFTPLAKLLKDNGYKTAAFGKRHLPKSLDTGWDYTCTTYPPHGEPSDEDYWKWVEQQGYGAEFKRDWDADMGSYDNDDTTESVNLSTQISQLPPDYTMEAYTAKKTIQYLRDAKEQESPFFCWCSFYRPHQPFTPPQKYADLYDIDKIKLPDNLHEPIENLPPMLQGWRKGAIAPINLSLAAKDENLYRKYIACYYALVTEIDHWIGKIFKTLEEEKLLDNTIIIYTADHGGFVGGHGMYEKCAWGHNVYEDTLRVPFIIYAKNVFLNGKTYNGLVELTDIYPTLLELAGIDKPATSELAGLSLVSTLAKGMKKNRKYAISENWSQVSIIMDRYKLGKWIEVPKDVLENKKIVKDYRSFGDMLFDLKTDPGETNNIINDPEVAKIKEELYGYLDEWSMKTNRAGKDGFSKS